MVAAYIDILIHRRIWNFRAIDSSTMQYAMFLVMRDIRGKNVEELIANLGYRLDLDEETFALSDHFKSGQRLSLQNRPTGLAVRD